MFRVSALSLRRIPVFEKFRTGTHSCDQMKILIVKVNLLVFLGFLAVLSMVSCGKEDKNGFASCNEILYSGCDGTSTAAYCLFGIKWNQPASGQRQPADSTVRTELSYAFMDSGYRFNTHSQNNLVSISFDKVMSCSRQSIRDAFAEWERVAALKFTETDKDNPDIRIILADISQGGLGYPPFSGEPCNELAGLLIIRPIPDASCESYYYLALHETGHILGLGHVLSKNVMNPNQHYAKLQPGDTEGIQLLYGKN